MKLKKIAALALAGVMAVSMLAGCGSNKPDPDPNPDEGTTTTTGYSAELGAAVDTDKTNVTFKDNAADQAALEKALENLSSKTLAQLAGHNDKIIVKELEDGNTYADIAEMFSSFKTNADITGSMNSGMLAFASYDGDEGEVANDKDLRAGVMFVVNGNVTTEAALNQISSTVATKLNSAADQSKNEVKFDYNYVVSASAVTKTLQPAFSGANNSLTFVAVTVTRNVSLAG